MREILYRGKRIDTKEWVEGLLTFDEFINPNTGIESAYCIKSLPNENHECLYWIPVIPETVGQFTGLCDKNGKKIFEGDITKDKYHKHLVCFGEHKIPCCGCCFDYHQSVGFYLNRNGENIVESGQAAWIDLEIIGNIHDNPELLKESESK